MFFADAASINHIHCRSQFQIFSASCVRWNLSPDDMGSWPSPIAIDARHTGTREKKRDVWKYKKKSRKIGTSWNSNIFLEVIVIFVLNIELIVTSLFIVNWLLSYNLLFGFFFAASMMVSSYDWIYICIFLFNMTC